MSGTYALHLYQGATVDRTLTWENEAGTPYDITGWTAKMEIREREGGTVYATLTTTDGTIVLGGVAGTIRLLVDAATTAAWTWKSGVYDLLLTNPSPTPDQTTRLIGGPAILHPGVTQL